LAQVAQRNKHLCIMRFFGLVGVAVAFVNPPPVFRQAPAQQTYYTPYEGAAPVQGFVPVQGYAVNSRSEGSRLTAPLAFLAGAGTAGAALHFRRGKKITMNAPARLDADGNPITEYEMFDIFWVVVALTPYLALLVLNPF